MRQIKPGIQDNVHSVIGKAIDSLPLMQRQQLSGFWVATEIYSPQRLPLRVVQAIAASPQECIVQLQQKGMDPTRFEYELVQPAFIS